MKHSPASPGKLATALKGAAVGFLSTQTLDWVSKVMYSRENRTARAREDQSRSHHHAYETAILHLSKIIKGINEDDAKRHGWHLHKTLGVLGEVFYTILRKRYRFFAAGQGLVYGLAFFLIVDEVLVPLLKLSPGPFAFPWQTHARGLASHLSYGVTAETTAKILDPIE